MKNVLSFILVVAFSLVAVEATYSPNKPAPKPTNTHSKPAQQGPRINQPAQR